MSFDGDTGERLGEDIGDHVSSGEEVSFDLTALDDFTNPVPLDVDVLHTAMVFRIPEDLECGLVVDHEACRSLDFHSNLVEKGAKPKDLATCRGSRDILGLSGRVRDDGLFLGRPAHRSSAHLDEES